MADEAERRAWIKRVLGFEFPSKEGGPGTAPESRVAAQQPAPVRRGAPLMPIWRDAKEEVDSAIGKLQDALRAAKDEDLDAIADYGLFGVTKGQTARLMAALGDADRDRSPEALDNLMDAVEDFRAFLEAAPIIDFLENNPFGVVVPMRRRFGVAFAELERQAAA